MIIRRHAFVALVSLVVIVALWAPFTLIAINSVNRDVLLSRWDGFTLKWYGDAADSPGIRSGLASSLTIASCTSLLSVVLAVTGALWRRRASATARRIFDLVTLLRIILPEVVFAVALLTMFARLGVPLGTTAVVVGHTVWASAFAALVIQAGIAALDPGLEDAAADLGASRWRVLRRVTIPALRPAIVAAALLVFTFSFDDIVTSYFLAGPNVAPLPVVLVNLIRFRVGPDVNAIVMLVMAFTVATMAIGFYIVARLSRGGFVGSFVGSHEAR